MTNKILEQYFALKSADKLASEMLSRADQSLVTLNTNQYLAKLTKSWKMYYGISPGQSFGNEINFTGEEGELVSIGVNHYRNIAQHMLTMVTANRPIMEARAINSDAKSQSQTTLANLILDYYMKEKRIEASLKAATEYAIVFGAGFLKLSWNATGGDIYNANPDDTSEIDYEGELEVSPLSPFDIVVDGTRNRWNHDWILTKSSINKFVLIAKFPELADQIYSQPSKQSMFQNIQGVQSVSNYSTDDILVYEFYHKRNEAVPDGRYVQFLDKNVILIDTGLPYSVIPVFRIASGDILGTPLAYSSMFDVMPIQEAIDSTYSAILSNQNAFGVQSIFVPRGSDISISSMQGGLNIVEGNSQPQPLNLTQTPVEMFRFLDTLISSAETISGVNSVARGNPEASLKSGNALALVQSMALQFISGLQHSYVDFLEDVGTSIINILIAFVKTPKTIALVGKHNRTMLKSFVGSDIDSINRVVVDVGNPLSRTTAGRVQMAEQMLQMGLIKNPEQYFSVINTGRLDVMYEGEMAELMLVREENESLMEGAIVTATAIDQHKMHILEHRSILASIEARKNALLVKNTLHHIQEHLDLLRQTDPALLQLIGEQSLPPLAQVPATPLEQTESEIRKTPLASSPIPGILAPEQAGNQQVFQGPEAQIAGMPNLPQVNPNLLPNPELQAQSLGNIQGQPHQDQGFRSLV